MSLSQVWLFPLDTISCVTCVTDLLLNAYVMQTDPGVPVVYAGFGALMLTTCISYLSHSQVNLCIFIFNTKYMKLSFAYLFVSFFLQYCFHL